VWGGHLSYKVFAHVMYVRHTCRKNVVTRIMAIFEDRIFRELLEIVRVGPINYDIVLKNQYFGNMLLQTLEMS
jgi:hypothetical protein